MKIVVLNIVVVGLLSSSPTSIEFLKPPPSGNSERGTTVTSSKTERLRWKSEWTMGQETVGGRRIVRFTEKGNGRYSPFDREVQWNTETVWTAQEWFRPLRSERTVTDSVGRAIVKERKSFNFDTGSVDIEREDLSNGSVSRRSLNIPADTVTVDGLAGALRSLPFERTRSFELHVLSNEPKLYEVSFEVRGIEPIRTPAGEFRCYKVELRPGLGVLNLFGFLIPKAYFWFTVDPPHYWVRYEGPENGRGTPQIVIELSTFERSN